MTWRMDAGAYARFWTSLAAPARAAVAGALDLARGIVLLDIGCGPGDFCALAIERGAQASGLDLDPAMIVLARTRAPRADLRVGSMDALPWPNAAFDAATAFNVLQFAETPARALSEARRVLRPGGRLPICSWSPPRHTQINLIEAAVHAATHGIPPTPPLRPLARRGGLDGLLATVGSAPSTPHASLRPSSQPTRTFSRRPSSPTPTRHPHGANRPGRRSSTPPRRSASATAPTAWRTNSGSPWPRLSHRQSNRRHNPTNAAGNVVTQGEAGIA